MSVDADPRLSWLDARFPAAAQLAELASFAARIDTGLLRRLRQQFLPAADVSTESELWFSPVVESRSATGFQIAAEVLPALRERLVSMQDRPAVGAVRDVLSRAHATASPAIRLEEAVNGIALEFGAAGQAAIEQELRPVLSALSRGDTDAIDVARWIINAVPRLHPLVRDTANARTIVMSAAMLLRGRARLAGGKPDPTTRISTLGWALGGALESRRVGVAFVPAGLQFGPPSETAGFVDVPLTDPPIVEVEWQLNGSDRQKLTSAAEGVLVQLDGDPDEVTITTLLGDQYRVTATPVAGSAANRRAVLPPADLLEACDQIEPLGRDSQPIGVVFAIGEHRLLGISTAIGHRPIVGVVGDTEQLEVEGYEADAPFNETTPSIVVLRPANPESWSHWKWLPIATPVQDSVRRAAAAGFIKGNSGWYDVAIEPRADDQGRRRGVLFSPPSVPAEDLSAGFVGSPLVADGQVVGVVARIVPPQPNESYAVVDIFEGAHLAKLRAAAGPQAPVSRPLVFISYAIEDMASAERIHKALVDAGFDVFFDRTALEAGASWRNDTRRAIEHCDVFLAVISKHSFTTELRAFHDEWRLADEQRRLREERARSSEEYYRGQMVLVVIDGSPPDGLPALLQRLQRVEALRGELPREFIEQLRASYQTDADDAGRFSTRNEADVPDPDRQHRLTDVLIPGEVRTIIIDRLIRSSRPEALVANGSRQSAVDEIPRFVGRMIQRELSARVELVTIHLDVIISVEDAVAAIARHARLDASKMPRTADLPMARSIQHMVRWLLSAFELDRIRRILVIDGFEQDIRREVFEFIDELIVHRGPPTALGLILLNYTARLPPQAAAMVTEFTLQPVDEGAVDEFFRQVFDSIGREYDGRVVDAAKDRVMRLMRSPDWVYHDLRRLLHDIARALTEPHRGTEPLA